MGEAEHDTRCCTETGGAHSEALAAAAQALAGQLHNTDSPRGLVPILGREALELATTGHELFARVHSERALRSVVEASSRSCRDRTVPAPNPARIGRRYSLSGRGQRSLAAIAG